ncbi:MAG: GTPase [Alphaproteobacteria bacterium]
MRLRTFHGSTMAEAMREVREVLGPEAIIVSSQRARRGHGVRITAAIEHLVDDHGNGAAPTGPEPDADHPIAQALAYHGVPAVLAAALCRSAAGDGDGNLAGALARALGQSFSFAPLDRAPARPVMLVGPPGAGKTVTTAKLATRAAMAGHPVEVITTDTIRAGGVDQLSAFTKLLKVPLTTADTPAELGQALTSHRQGAATFVDTPGTNVFNPREFDDLRDFSDGLGLDIVLVLAAGGDSVEAAELAEAFATLGPGRLIVTRLDVSRRLGVLLAAADAAQLTLGEAGASPFVGQGLTPLDPSALARLLMGDPTMPHARSECDKAVT